MPRKDNVPRNDEGRPQRIATRRSHRGSADAQACEQPRAHVFEQYITWWGKQRQTCEDREVHARMTCAARGQGATTVRYRTATATRRLCRYAGARRPRAHDTVLHDGANIDRADALTRTLHNRPEYKTHRAQAARRTQRGRQTVHEYYVVTDTASHRTRSMRDIYINFWFSRRTSDRSARRVARERCDARSGRATRKRHRRNT